MPYIFGLILLFSLQAFGQSSLPPSSGVAGTTKVTDGTDLMLVNTDGSINVQGTNGTLNVGGSIRVLGASTSHFVIGSAVGDILGSSDVAEYGQLNFSLRNTFVADLQITVSTDTGAFYPVMIYKSDGSAPSLTVSAPGSYYAMLDGRYFKAALTSYTSGAVWFSSFVKAVPHPNGPPLWVASSANQTTGNTSLSNINTKLPSLLATAPASDTGQSAIPVRIISQLGAGGGGGGLTDTQLRASAVPVSIATSVAVTGTFWPTTAAAPSSTRLSDGSAFYKATTPSDTQPISAASLPLPSGASTSALQTTGNSSLSSMDTKTPALGQALSASSVPVVLTAAQLSTLTPLASISVSNFPGSQAVTGPLTDTQLRATAVPVSGTVAVSNAIALDATLTSGSQKAIARGGAKGVTAAADVTSTSVDANTQALDVSVKGTVPVSGSFFQTTQPVSIATMPTTPVTGTFFQATQPVSGTFFQATQPVSIATMPTTPVTGAFFQATQPISIAATVAVSGPLTDTQIRATALPVSGTVTANAGTGTMAVSGPLTDTQLRLTAVPVSGTVTATGPLTDTQIRATALPVSGTVTANATLAAETTKVIGTINIAASQTIAATQSGAWTVQPGNTANTTAWLVKPNDGTNSITIKAASTAATATDTAEVVAISPNNGVSLGTSIGKTITMKTGALATTAVTADAVILTYTVTSGKTFYLTYFMCNSRLTTFAATATYFGTCSLESPAGTKLLTTMLAGSGIADRASVPFTEPIPIAAGTVIRVVTTPSAATAFTWTANFGGYEK